MSNKKDNNSLISDEKTLMRRAWIDLAMDGVRARLNFGALEERICADNLAAGYETRSPESEPAGTHRRHLYLAYSAGKRRRTGIGS